jgi:hypothetical protein
MVWDLNKDPFFNNVVLQYPVKQQKDSGGRSWRAVGIQSPVWTYPNFTYKNSTRFITPQYEEFISPANVDNLANIVASYGFPKPSPTALRGYLDLAYNRFMRWDYYTNFRPIPTSRAAEIAKWNAWVLNQYLQDQRAEKNVYDTYMMNQFNGLFDDPDRQFRMSNMGRKSRAERLFKMPFDDEWDETKVNRYIGKRDNLDWGAIDPTHVTQYIPW